MATERYWLDGTPMTDEEVAELAAEHAQNQYETEQSALSDLY